MGNEVRAKLVERSITTNGFPVRDNETRLLNSLKTFGNSEWRLL